MYKIEKQPYGYYLTFSGSFKQPEMKKWIGEIKDLIRPGNFSLYIDMNEFKSFDPAAKKIMEEGYKHFKVCGLERSIVVVSSTTYKTQFQRMSKETGMQQWERYITSDTPNYKELAMSWLEKGTEPETEYKAA